MYPVLLQKYVNVYKNKQKDAAIIQDKLNHMLGQYIGFAINAPKQYPRQAYLDRAKMPTVMSAEEMHNVMKKLATKIKDKPNNDARTTPGRNPSEH
jgi:hypothetical protein